VTRETIYGFIAAEKTTYPVRLLCRILQVSTSAFYDWLGRGSPVIPDDDLDDAPDRDVAQRLLSNRLLPVPQRRVEQSPADRVVASWLDRASRPINDLTDEITASELLLGLGKSVTGRTVTTSTWDKRRAVLHRAIEFARASGWIDTNPLTGRRTSIYRRPVGVGSCSPDRAPRSAPPTTPRPAPGTRTGRSSGAAPRTSVPSRSRRTSWRSSVVTSRSSRPRRTAGCSSPPRAAAASRGRSVYSRIWADARTIGLSPAQAASPLARRPYDLRHAALSSWLAAGVPPTEVAARAGNSVKVLLTVYAKCLADQQDTYNDRISGAPRPMIRTDVHSGGERS
jgi:hypothetical protein